MKFVKIICACLGTAFLAGCHTASTDPSYMTSQSYQARARAETTLFKGDEAILGGETIEVILNARVELPANCRLALLALNARGTQVLWSPESVQASEEHAVSVIAELRKCEGLADVSILPSLLTPEKNGVPQLREAAARFQAHLLLVYTSTFDSYRKYRYFAKDRARAYCKIEAALLDVRTGIVPFSSVSLQQYTVEEEKEDMSMYEATMRAQIMAETEGLKEIARDLKQFLDAVLPQSSNNNRAANPAQPDR